jgi:Putative DNA-binding domain
MTTQSTAQLAQDQAALLHALMAWPREADAESAARLNVHQHTLTARGLNAYRANAHSGAERALRASYPVLALMLGDESFDAMARAFWHGHLPSSGDWAQWGEALSCFIEAAEQLADAPYLTDVARVEWEMHSLATAPDTFVQAQSFDLLTQRDPAELTFQLAPHCAAWQSAWPVVSLVHAHTLGDAQNDGVDDELLEQARVLLAQGVSESILVWRDGWRPCVREALKGEAEFLNAITNGQSLDAALNQSPNLDFVLWLQTAIQTRLLTAVTQIAVIPN